MSKKINVLPIVVAHYGTLKNQGEKRISLVDSIVFFVIPIASVCFLLYKKYSFDADVSALLINFGAIFTALLLSVLVMIYDQKLKLVEENNGTFEGLKGTKRLRYQVVSELYINICFSVLLSILVVTISFMNYVWGNVGFRIPKTDIDANLGWVVFTPITTFITISLVLTVFMVIKRMFVILADN